MILNKEIEIGEYIRTEDGYIEKIKTIVCHDYPIEELRNKIILKDKSVIDEEDIVKHSKKLIEIIEVGDYVNGSMVYEKFKDGRVHIMRGLLLDNKDIKSIVTKEEFESREYKVGV